MWCFFDESYPREGSVTSVVACLMRDKTVRHLDEAIYQAQKRAYGRDHARNLQREIKGKDLLSNYSFKMARKYNHSKNHQLVEDILKQCSNDFENHPIFVFGAAVYGAKDILKKMSETEVTFPIVDILRKVSAAATEISTGQSVNLVFDENLADRNSAISIRRFVSGVKLPNVSHYPFVGVSHVTPGIQLSDIGAYILGRRAVGDDRFKPWLSQLRNLEWKGEINGYQRLGIQRWDVHPDGRATVRKKWA